MSNLTLTDSGGFTFASQFDVLRGWPFGGAVEESYKVTSGTVIKEGQIVQLDGSSPTDGSMPLVKVVTDAPDSAAGKAAQVFVVIQGSDQFDAKFVGKVVTLRGVFTIKTEKFVAASMVVGAALSWVETVGATQGYLAVVAGTDKQIGVCSEYDSANGFIVAAMNV